MKYRKLAGDMNVSCIALGGNIFGHFCSKEETFAIMDLAGDLGINFIDSADVYSEGLSETYIGNFLKKKRESWIIATKAGIRSGDSSGGLGTKTRILNGIEGSLRRLKTDYIDLYQIHHFDNETPLEETLETLDMLIKQGKVRYIGCSNYSGKQLSDAIQLASMLGINSFVTIQNYYNLFKRRAESELFPVCKKMQMGFITYGALARGILSGKYSMGKDIPPTSRAYFSSNVRADLTHFVLETVDKLQIFASRRNKTVGQLALAWILKKKEVLALIVGIRNNIQLNENIEAVEWDLSREELLEIDNIVGDLELYNVVSLGNCVQII